MFSCVCSLILATSILSPSLDIRQLFSSLPCGLMRYTIKQWPLDLINNTATNQTPCVRCVFPPFFFLSDYLQKEGFTETLATFQAEAHGALGSVAVVCDPGQLTPTSRPCNRAALALRVPPTVHGAFFHHPFLSLPLFLYVTAKTFFEITGNRCVPAGTRGEITPYNLVGVCCLRRTSSAKSNLQRSWCITICAHLARLGTCRGNPSLPHQRELVVRAGRCAGYTWVCVPPSLTMCVYCTLFDDGLHLHIP